VDKSGDFQLILIVFAEEEEVVGFLAIFTTIVKLLFSKALRFYKTIQLVVFVAL
jgi:hypothetical protein